MIETVALALEARSPKEHVTTPPMFEQVPTEDVAERKDAPAGSGLVKTTFTAVPGPRLVTTIILVSGRVAAAGLGVRSVLKPKSATGRFRAVVITTTLFDGLGSVSLAATLAAFVSVNELIPCPIKARGRTTPMVTVATAPVEIVPRLPMTLVALVITNPWDDAAETSVTPGGNMFVNATEEAGLGPRFETVNV